MVSISSAQLLIWWYLLVGLCVLVKLALGIWRWPPKRLRKSSAHISIVSLTLVCVGVHIPMAHGSFFIQMETGLSLPIYIIIVYLNISVLNWVLYGYGRFIVLWPILSSAATAFIIWAAYEFYEECTSSGYFLLPAIIWQFYITYLFYRILMLNAPKYKDEQHEKYYAQEEI